MKFDLRSKKPTDRLNATVSACKHPLVRGELDQAARGGDPRRDLRELAFPLGAGFLDCDVRSSRLPGSATLPGDRRPLESGTTRPEVDRKAPTWALPASAARRAPEAALNHRNSPRQLPTGLRRWYF